KDHVIVAVFIDINETQAAVPAVMVDDLRPGRKQERQPHPRLLLRRPSEDAFAGNQLTPPVAVQITQPDAEINSRIFAGQKRFAIDFQAGQEGPLFHPAVAVERPRARLLFIVKKQGWISGRLHDAETDGPGAQTLTGQEFRKISN